MRVKPLLAFVPQNETETDSTGGQILRPTPAALCGHAANTAAPDPLVVDAATLAAMLDIGERTLWRLLSAGRLPGPVTIGAKMRRWRLDEIREWTAAGCPSRSEWDAARAARRGG